jgi:hypothetical protein
MQSAVVAVLVTSARDAVQFGLNQGASTYEVGAGTENHRGHDSPVL